MQSNLIEFLQDDCRQVMEGAVDALAPLSETCVLITGGTGFVGKWLAELISYLNDHHGFRTRLILLSGRANNFKANVPHLAMRTDIMLIERDVRSILDLPDDVTWVIHAAGNPDNRMHVSNPLEVMQVIVQGTQVTLEAATRLPHLKKFLNISSGLIYGTQPWDMEGISEGFMGTVDCKAVNAAYAEAKRCAETLCAAYRNQHRLPIVTARPFAFIGPYQLLDRPWAVNNFIHDGLLGGPIRILGDGQTIRSYMYPSDMACWLLRLLIHGAVGLSYNVGSPHGIRLQRLAELIAEQFSCRPKIVTGIASGQQLLRSKFVPDVTLAQRTLGLKLHVDLDTAIQRTLQWHKEAQQVQPLHDSRSLWV